MALSISSLVSFGRGKGATVAYSNLLPTKAIQAMAGTRFVCGVTAGATYKAPIATIPTTTASWAFYNGESVSGGATFFIERIYAYLKGGTSDGSNGILVGIPSTIQAAAVAAATGTLSGGLNGGAVPAVMTMGTAITLAGTPVWHVVSNGSGPAPAGLGGAVAVADIDGGIMLPPGFALGLEVWGGAGTSPLFGMGVTGVALVI